MRSKKDICHPKLTRKTKNGYEIKLKMDNDTFENVQIAADIFTEGCVHSLVINCLLNRLEEAGKKLLEQQEGVTDKTPRH